MALEVQMRSLVGNGQPGRVDLLDRRVGPLESIPTRVDALEKDLEGLRKESNDMQKKMYIGLGVLIALQFLHANGLLNVGHLLAK